MLSRRVEAEEQDIEVCCEEIVALGSVDDERWVATDLLGGPAALLEAVLLERGERLFHLPGMTVNRARDGSEASGESKSDARNAHMIAYPQAIELESMSCLRFHHGLLGLVEEVLALASEVVWATDQPGGGAALLLAFLWERGQRVIYGSGLSADRARDSYRGKSKTNRRDARVIPKRVYAASGSGYIRVYNMILGNTPSESLNSSLGQRKGR